MLRPRSDRTRREFLKAAVAIGGASALSACTERLGDDAPDVPTGDPASVPDRQHAWDDFLPRDDHGNVVAPHHHVLLLLDYAGKGEPTADDRETARTALADLERAYKWGGDGLLFTVSYSPAYFERFGAGPTGVDLPEPEALSPFEEPEFDRPDLVVHLASMHATVVLEAEQALMGERSDANGVEFEAALSAVTERVDRRTGFVGNGLPAKHQDVKGIPEGDPVPEDSPLYMGFKSGFTKNQATEDSVTIADGPFAGGTTQHVSHLRLRLDDWYVEQDHEERVAEMFCPAHATSGKIPEGETGEGLGDNSGMDDCEDPVDSASSYGRIGHSQKIATDARRDGSPVIIRRDFNSTDGGEAGLHFVALHREIQDFVDTRTAMNGTKYTENPAIRQRVNNGILEYIFVTRRGNYLVPPRSLRAFPTSDGG
jgi:hypothetical protein